MINFNSIFSIDKTTCNTHNIINLFGFKIKYKVYNRYKTENSDIEIANYLKYKSKRVAKSVVYTCITNNYDNIEDIKSHKYINKDWDYVCFTDNKKQIKKGIVGIWEIRPLYFTKLDNTRNQRWHKTHPHILFPNYKSSLWVDGNVNFLTNKIFNLINDTKSLILLPTHSKNNCIYQEYEDVKNCGLDNNDIVNKELEYIKSRNMPINYGFTETNILYRVHSNPMVAKMMDEWWYLIENYSKRDQLSFQYVMWDNNILTKDISFDYDRTEKIDFCTYCHRKNSHRKLKNTNHFRFFEVRHFGEKRKVFILNIPIFSYSSKNIDVIDYAKSLGVILGQNVRFITNNKFPYSYPNFGSEPFLIEIGDDCVISFGVTFLTHDGSRKNCLKFIKESERKNLINWKKVKIGNNVFIGCNSIIMPGVQVGNDVVIGAGSVVTKDIPDGEVWAGNPAKYIKKTEELAQKLVELNKTEEIKEIKTKYIKELRKNGLMRD